MYLYLFVFSALLPFVFCEYVDSNSVYYYQLPDDDINKSLSVTINSTIDHELIITIECNNYDSLKFFEVRVDESQQIRFLNGVSVKFNKCFNNETDTENNKFRLDTWFNSLPYAIYQNGYPFTINLNEYADVNTEVLYKNFNFDKFNTVAFTNVGFTSTKFLSDLHCINCIFENNGRINFNDFGEGVIGADELEISHNQLLNLNRDNLSKFAGLEILDISEFDLDDYNTFNVPDLFEHNSNLTFITVENSKEKIILHEQMFRGLKHIDTIILRELMLDYIPKELFKDLESLTAVLLSYNSIKTVDPVTFETNSNLRYVSFANNPFYTEPHDYLESIAFGGRIELELANFTIHTFDLYEQLTKNPKVKWIAFQSFLIDQFNVTHFTKLSLQRDHHVDVHFRKGEPHLDLEQIKSFGNVIHSENDLKLENRINVVIYIKFAGDAICHDCTMIKYLFQSFLKRYQNDPGFYIEENRLFIKFEIPESCFHLHKKFEVTIDENCPDHCVCKFNSLMEKVKIDCSNQNLTTIPHIPYPIQVQKLHSIDLDFENNSISVLSLANQDANVLKKLSTLNFKNNKIETIQIDDTDLSNNIWGLNICGNPILASAKHQRMLYLASGYKYFTNSSCNTDAKYLQHVPIELNQNLNEMDCN